MAAAVVRRTCPSAAITNVYASGGDVTTIEDARKIQHLCRRAVVAGMFWSSAGVPDFVSGTSVGSLCLDSTNKDMYVSDGGAWNKLTTA